MNNNEPRSVSPDAIGAYLQQERISRNIGLEEVCDATGISAGVLKTLESDDREQFPAEVYVKAFYKKYAKYLGLDPEEILSAYVQKSGRQKKTRGNPNFDTVITLKGQEDNLLAEIARRLFVPVILILAGILLYWIYSNYLTSYNPIDLF